jgi:hypothetical protein
VNLPASSVSRPCETGGKVAGGESGSLTMRSYRWLTVSMQDREAPQLVREWVKCGKPSCHCAGGVRHGPYWYFRYEEWDRADGVVRYRREYVPRCELARVRGWIRRHRIRNGFSRSFLRLARAGFRA